MSVVVPLSLHFEFFSADFVQKQKLLRFHNLLILVPDKMTIVTPGRAHAQTVVARAVPVSMNDKFAVWTSKKPVVLVELQVLVPLEAVAACFGSPTFNGSLTHNYFSSSQKSIMNTIDKSIYITN